MVNYKTISELYHSYLNETDSLCHHGIKGQKWGVRRFQNEDGTLTNEGKARYNQETAAKLKDSYEKLTENMIGESIIRIKNHKDFDEFCNKFTKDNSIVPIEYFSYKTMSGDKKKFVDDSAKLALQALKSRDKDPDIDPDDNGWKHWMMFDDQTFGMTEIAQLIKNGVPAERVNQLMKNLRTNDDIKDAFLNDKLQNDFAKMLAMGAYQSRDSWFASYYDKYTNECEKIFKSEYKPIK